MQEMLVAFSQWLHPYFQEIALMLVATVLVIYGDVINKHLKKALSSYHFVLRTLAFVLICAFGYGALTNLALPLVVKVLWQIPVSYQGVSILGCMLVLGYLAENRRYI